VGEVPQGLQADVVVNAEQEHERDRRKTLERGICLVSYRIEMAARVWPFLVPATLLISLGALGVCMAFVTHGPLTPYAGMITLAGGACMLAGLILTLFVAKPVLTHDEYVAALEKGLLLKVDGAVTFLAWGGIASVKWDAVGPSVVIHLRDGDPVLVSREFATAKGNDVAVKLDELRRKAAFHLL
jgi:hypothetical protein